MALTLNELAQHVGGRLHGLPQCAIRGVATLLKAEVGDITFLANPRYRRYLRLTRASAVILAPRDAENYTGNAVVVDNPYAAYARVATLLHPVPRVVPGIHPSAVIDPSARIDPSASVGPLCVIDAGAEIGPRVRLGPGCMIGADSHIGADSQLVARVTVLHRVHIGQRALIHPGAVIGGDGFGLALEDERWLKVPQLGTVRIADDVEIGANTTIDRGALEDTVIEDGVKLDNQIQVAHNVHIGAHTAIAGCTGIAGSARIGQRCTIGGSVGILGHLDIADDVNITAMSLVTKSITQPGWYSSGVPVDDSDHWNRSLARLRQLDQWARRVKALENGAGAQHENADTATYLKL